MSLESAEGDLNPVKKVKELEVKVVPWYNAAQFQKVYQYLYSPDIMKKNWALDQINVWQTRCYPSLPGAIDVTFGLVVASVQDDLWRNGNTLSRQMDIEMAYISAIFKFVNWFLNSRRDLVEQGVTSAQIAKMLGIPSYIVDMRNEGCHSNAPSLACLRLAVEDAMEHLKTSYWELEAAQVKNHVRKTPDTKEIKQLIRQFMKNKLQIMRDQEKSSSQEKSSQEKPSSQEKEKSSSQEKEKSSSQEKEKSSSQEKEKSSSQGDRQYEMNLKKHLEAINELIEKNRNLFIKALVMDGYFIPHDEDMKYFVTEEKYKLFQEAYEPNADISDTAALIKSTMPDVPEMHEALWVPIIYYLNLHNAVPMFMEALLRSQGDRTIAGQKLIIAWVLKILRIHSINGYARGSTLRSIFKHKAIIVNWESLFVSSLENPCVYTSFVFPLILCHLNFSQDILKRFMQLFAYHVGLTADINDVPVTGRIFTVDDILKARKRKLPNDESSNSKKFLWSPVADDSYKKWPIGIVLNPISEKEVVVEEEDLSTEEKEYTFEYIIGNENDTEDEDEHYCNMEIDNLLPDKFLKDFMDELNKKETLLYK